MTQEQKEAMEWLDELYDANHNQEVTDRCRATLKAMLAQLTRPKTKLVWRVQPEGWPCEDFEAINSATARAGHWLAQDIEVSIRQTEVSA